MPRAHRNLHSLKPGSKALPWSYYLTAGERVRGARFLILDNVTPKHPSGKKAAHCLAGTGNRSVFAWLKCEKLTAEGVHLDADCFWRSRYAFEHTPGLGTARLRLNPTHAGGDQFFHVDGQKYTGSERVWLCEDGRAYTSTENLTNV